MRNVMQSENTNINKVIVADDDFVVRTKLRVILENLNVKVYEAENGNDVIQLIQNFIPDLIFCDIMMPKMNGIEVFKRFKNSNKFKNTPFIFISSHGEINEYLKDANTEAYSYITKPFKKEEIEQIVLKSV